MFIKNNTEKDIKLTSFEGYTFTIPTGISWIWDKAGEVAMEKWGTPNGTNGIYSFRDGQRAFTQTVTKLAIAQSNEREWAKGGKKVARVERFRVNYDQIPRSKLIGLAQKRGVPMDKVQEFLADENVDSSIIADVINSLPVPDELRYPQEIHETVSTSEDSVGTAS